MIQVSHNYRIAAQEGRPEVFLSVWTTVRGRYLYSTVHPSKAMIDFFGKVCFWNGVDFTLGSGQRFGAIPVVEYGARLVNPGSIKESLAPLHDNLLLSLSMTERGAVSVEYDNTDGYFDQLWGDQRNEPFLYQGHEMYHGFLGLDPADFVKFFTGEIRQIQNRWPKAITISEAQSPVYTRPDTTTSLTAYALMNPYVDANTLLLIHSDTTDGSSTFVDSSDYGLTVSVNGTVTHEDTQAKFGNTSIQTAGVNTDYLSTTAQDFGTGDFTIDFWMYLVSAAGNHGVMQTNWNPGVFMWFEPGTSEIIYVKAGTTGATVLQYDATGLLFNTWVHVEISRASGTLRLFLDGVVKASQANTNNITGGGGTVQIGATTAVGGNGFSGFLDEFRISNVARHTAAFPPPPSPYGKPDAVLAQGTFTHAALATVFFATDNWTCTINFDKDEIDTAGVLFQLLNNGTETTLEIGIDATNYAYVTTGQDVEGTPATTTYTANASPLTTALIANHVNLFVKYDHTNSLITFAINGVTNSQAATVPYDRTGTNNEQVTIGSSWEGSILNVKFNNTFFATNNQGSNLLTTLPDVVRGNDLTVVDGQWEAW